MFSATFLGHQGWMFSSRETHILVDPLLFDEFGQTATAPMLVYPSRQLRLDALPPISAVFFTHEHEDHFNLRTLQSLSRDIPIYLSVGSSLATRDIITELGFELRFVHPGVPVRVGDLELIPIAPEHAQWENQDEWDVLPSLVRDVHGDGSFFNCVDVMISKEMMREAAKFCRRPGLYCSPNNAMNMSAQRNFKPESGFGAALQLTRQMLDIYTVVASAWGEPQALLLIGQGLAFPEEASATNHAMFSYDMQKLVSQMSEMSERKRFHAPLPGQTFVMKSGVIVDVEASTSFLQTRPPAEWPARDPRPEVKLDRYAPGCGVMKLPPGELPRLRARLDELARFLYGRMLFRQLYSLTAAELDGREPVLSLALLDGEQRRMLAFTYEPQGCRFVEAYGDPHRRSAAVLECWATDLLALLDGEMAPSGLLFGRCRYLRYVREPSRFLFSPLGALAQYGHPLFQPRERFLALYRRLHARHRDEPILVHAPRTADTVTPLAPPLAMAAHAD